MKTHPNIYIYLINLSELSFSSSVNLSNIQVIAGVLNAIINKDIDKYSTFHIRV